VGSHHDLATSPKTKPGEVQAALDLFKDKLGATEIITDEETA
jgi:hypothetical protein